MSLPSVLTLSLTTTTASRHNQTRTHPPSAPSTRSSTKPILFFPAALLRLLTKENDDQHTVRAPTPLLSLSFSILPSVSVFVSVSQTKKTRTTTSRIREHHHPPPSLSVSVSVAVSDTIRPDHSTGSSAKPILCSAALLRPEKKKEYDDRPASQAPPDTLLSLLSRTSPDKTPYTAQRVSR